MKMSGLVFSLVMAANMNVAAARSIMLHKPIAQYTFGLIQDSSDGSSTFGEFVLKRYIAVVMNTGTLKVADSAYSSNNRWHADPTNQIGDENIVVKKLHKEVFTILKSDIEVLANAEIKKTHSPIVCMMMPSWEQSQDNLMVARQFDAQLNIFKGNLELVDGPHGCWNSNQTHPVEKVAHDTAIELKRSLKLLAL
jgi:hypothetical protein